MSFSDIKDPIERERIVQDYKRLKREIREKSEDKKISSNDQAVLLAKRYAPIVRSQKKMTEDIVKELKKNNQDEGVEDVNIKSENAGWRGNVKSEDQDLYSGSLAEEYLRRYRTRDPDIDTEFGLNFLRNGIAVIGKTPVIIQGDDIIIGDEVYSGSEAVWELLTEKKKENFVHQPYSEADMKTYYDILKKTNVLRQNFEPDSTKPRSSQSWKWRNILSKLWKKMKDDDNSSEEEVEKEDDEE